MSADTWLIVNGGSWFANISVSEIDSFRLRFRNDDISVDTYIKYLNNITEASEIKVALLLPNKFASYFHGWLAYDTNYMEKKFNVS